MVAAGTLAGLLLPAAATPAHAATTAQTAFISSLVKGARGTQQEFGVPASVTLSQAILESGWGSSTLSRAPYNNLFGIKCGSKTSPFQSGCVTLPTREYFNGTWVTVNASFRTYATVTDSIYDHGYYLRYRGIYDQAFTVNHSPRLFASAIATAGYATDPTYAQKLLNVAWQNDLYQYDWGRSLGSALADPRLQNLTVAGAQVERAGYTSSSGLVATQAKAKPRPGWWQRTCGDRRTVAGRAVAFRVCR